MIALHLCYLMHRMYGIHSRSRIRALTQKNGFIVMASISPGKKSSNRFQTNSDTKPNRQKIPGSRLYITSW